MTENKAVTKKEEKTTSFDEQLERDAIITIVILIVLVMLGFPIQSILGFVYLNLAMIPIIAALDYMCFNRYAVCEQCGKKPHKWAWIIACFLETGLGALGILIGYLFCLKGGI